MLELIVARLVGIPGHDRRAGNNPLWMALNATGVATFLGDLTTLTEEDIMNLEIRPTRAVPNLSTFLLCTNIRRLLRLLLTIIALD